MSVKEPVPWSFTIEFDAEKAARNGYDIEDLYECVDKNVQRFGLTRLALGTWKANEASRVESQCRSLSFLSRQKWVMQNVTSLTAFERSTKPIDYIGIVDDLFPERICA